MVRIVLHYASEGDVPHVLEVERAMAKILGKDPKEYGLQVDRRCASAHKTPEYLRKIVMETQEDCIVRGVILGRQPALGPALDAMCSEPVVTYLIDGKDNPGQVYSSLNVPSGVGCMTAPPVGPDAMAIALLKITGVHDAIVREDVRKYQDSIAYKVRDADLKFKDLTTKEASEVLEAAKKK